MRPAGINGNFNVSIDYFILGPLVLILLFTILLSFPILAGYRLFELIEEGDLGRVDDQSGVGKREPVSLVDLGKGKHLTGPAGPFHFERIAHECVGIEFPGTRPGEDAFTTFLTDGAQRLKRTFERMTGLLLEFADGGIQGGFLIGKLPFGDSPDAGFLVLPEGAAGVYKEHLKDVGLAPV